MDITHLHLHTRDRAGSEAFYREHFGLRRHKADERITFMKGERDFLLALMDDVAPEPPPAWFHFGLGLPSSEAVRAKHAQLAEAGVAVQPLRDEAAITSFRCADPDGYAIEVYWLRS